MLLAALAETSRRVLETPARGAKIGLVAELLARAAPGELRCVVACLAGELRAGQDRAGRRGGAAGRHAPPAASRRSTLLEVDAALARIAALRRQGLDRARGCGDAAGTVRARHRRGAGLPAPAAGRRAAPGRARGRDGRGGRARGRRCRPRDVRRAAMLGGDLGAVAQRGAGARARARARALRASRCSGRCSRCSRRPPTTSTTRSRSSGARRSNGSSTARACRCTGPASDVRVYTRAPERRDRGGARDRRGARALPVRAIVLDGEAIALRPDGAPQPFQVTMRRFGRKLDVERMRARAAARGRLLRLPARSTARTCSTGRRRSALARSRAVAARRRSRIPRLVTADVADAEAFFAARARARPRGRDGQGARRAVRGRAPRRELAQAQARAHARPRRARRRVGQRPAQGLALQPAPRRARPRRPAAS